VKKTGHAPFARTGRFRKKGTVRFLLIAGFLLRIVGLQYGLPHVYNPDEVSIMARALSFGTGTLNPHNFLYPTFFFYVLFGWVGSYLALVWLTGGVSSLSELKGLYFSDPGGIYTAGRLLSALAGTATIAAVYQLARRLGDSRVALAAALFVAVSPLHVRDSHYVKHDVPATLAIVLAYLTLTRAFLIVDSRSARRNLMIAAATCGVAFSIHYYCVFLAIPLVATAVAAGRGSGLRRVVLNCLLVTGMSVGVFFLLSPFILLEPLTALRDITANREIVVDRASEAGPFTSVARYADMLLRDAVGIPVALLAAIGMFAVVRSLPAVGLFLLSFPVAFFLFIVNTFPASRYLNPLVPFAALFAAFAVSFLAKAISNRRYVICFWTFTAAAAAPALYQSARTDLFFRRTDTRTIALREIAATVPDGAAIAIQPYSAPLEPTRESLVRALERKLGRGAAPPPKFALQLSRQAWPTPSYDLVYLGRGLDADKVYVDYAELGGEEGLRALRQLGVAYVVIKRYNRSDPETLPFLAALGREGRMVATVSPYRPDTGNGDAPELEPFLHNTDARISAALERPGPALEIWQIDGPRQ
jgi:hypothetical protein